MAEGGNVEDDFKYSLTANGIIIYTNAEQEYVGKNYSPFESKGSFKATVRKADLENIAIESEELKYFDFKWGVDDWKSISKKLKNKGINKLELFEVGKIIKTFELKPLKLADGTNTTFDGSNDDIRFAEGGVTGDVFSIKDPEQFKQLITLYNKFSEKFDVDNYFVEVSSVVFLRKVKFTDAELKGMAQYIADLSKNQNFSIISDKKPEISNGYFKFFLKERVRYREGGNVGGVLDKFKDIILESKDFDSAFTKARLIKNVPKETANHFSEKYNPQDNLSMEEAFRKMYNEVKGIKGDSVSQLKKGIKVEKEHEKTFKKVAKGKISVKDAIKETAEEHISENPNYYDELELVDGEKKKEKFGDINVSRHKEGSKIAIRVYDTNTNELMILFYPSFLYPKKLTNKMAAEQMMKNKMTKQEKEYYEKKKNGTKFKEIPLPSESEDEIDLELLMKEAEMNVAKSKMGKKPTQKDIDEEFHRLLMEK
jgi:hypothetical protein